MRIVFFTDLHGNQYTYRRFVDDMLSLTPDHVVFGGDIFGYYYGQEDILSDIRNRGYTCLLGNHDKMFLDYLDGKINSDYLIGRYGNSYLNVENRISDENVQFIRNLKPEHRLSIDGLRLYFAHGSKLDPLNGRIYPDTDVTACDEYSGIDFAFLGHTHHQIIKYTHGCTIVNPGSAGQQRDGKGCKYVLFDTSTRQIAFKVIEYNRDSLVDDINRNDSGKMKEKLIEVLYRSSAISHSN